MSGFLRRCFAVISFQDVSLHPLPQKEPNPKLVQASPPQAFFSNVRSTYQLPGHYELSTCIILGMLSLRIRFSWSCCQIFAKKKREEKRKFPSFWGMISINLLFLTKTLSKVVQLIPQIILFYVYKVGRQSRQICKLSLLFSNFYWYSYFLFAHCVQSLIFISSYLFASIAIKFF